MDYFCSSFKLYHETLLKIENGRYYSTMRLTGILFSFLILLFGSYNISRGSGLQRASAVYKEGDYDTALQTFKPLAEKGDMIAQFNLAKMYREGKGVPKDYKTAVKWFSLSAEQGKAKAQYHLGVAHSFGLGGVPDYKIALKWFNRSAEQGNTFSQYHLSRLYYLGNGVPEDKVYAYMWANLASSRGFGMAQQLRQLLTEKMTSNQIETAQELARKCFKNDYNGC